MVRQKPILGEYTAGNCSQIAMGMWYYAEPPTGMLNWGNDYLKSGGG
jgi:hypothetical protein